MFDFVMYKYRLDVIKDRANELVFASSAPLNTLVLLQLQYDKQDGAPVVASPDLKLALTTSLLFNRNMHRVYSDLHLTIADVFNDVMNIEIDAVLYEQVDTLNTLADIIESLLLTANGIDDDFKQRVDRLFEEHGH